MHHHAFRRFFTPHHTFKRFVTQNHAIRRFFTPPYIFPLLYTILTTFVMRYKALLEAQTLLILLPGILLGKREHCNCC